jgi:hypothetical protein
LILTGLAFQTADPALARSSGITGVSGNPATGGQTCARCHSGGLMPEVSIDGPASVAVGSTNTYTLTISGGQRAAGGLDVSTTGGSFGTIPGNFDVQVLSGEITHASTKSANNMGDVIFSFLWTAPSSAGEVTLYGAGNSVNDNGSTGGDAADTDSLAIQVSEGGAPTPTDPPPTATGEPMPPTPFPTVESPYDLAIDDLANPHGITPLDGGSVLIGEGGTAGDTWTPGSFAPSAGDGRILEIDLAQPEQRQVLVVNMTGSMDPGGGVVGGNHAIRISRPGPGTETATVTLVAQSGGPGHARPEEAAKILMVDSDGIVSVLADTLAYEQANNPDGDEGEAGIDSNPWRLVEGPDGRIYIVDAGGNDILAMDPVTGELSTWAVFADLTEEGQQAIPTGLVFDSEQMGVAYVSLLGPFGPGTTQIRRLEDANDDGDMLDPDEDSLLIGGLKLVTDLGMGHGGHLFFTSIAGGTLSRLDPACWSAGMPCDNSAAVVVADQLPAASALAILADGDALVTTTNRPNPAGPNLNPNRIVRIPASMLAPAPEPTPTMGPPVPTETPTTPTDGGTIYLPFLARGHDLP